MIESLMCIGSACEGHEFAKVLNLRSKGPVDNLHGEGFHATVELFNGTFAKNINKMNFIPVELPNPEKYHTLKIGYKVGSFKIVHNDITQDKVYKEMLERIYLFNEYLIEAFENPNKYFLYTLNEKDRYYGRQELERLIKLLPKKILPQIIILQDRFINPAFTELFPSIIYESEQEFWGTLGTWTAEQKLNDLISRYERICQ